MYCSRENENKDQRIVGLEEKMAEAVRKIASLELGSRNHQESINELRDQNERLTGTNHRLIHQFADELGKIKTSDESSQEARHLSLKAMVGRAKYCFHVVCSCCRMSRSRDFCYIWTCPLILWLFESDNRWRT